MAIWNTLEAQFGPHVLRNPNLKPYHHAFLNLRKMPEDIRTFRAKTEKPGMLSERGIIDAVRGHAAKAVAPNLRREKYRLEQASQKLAAKRKALSVPNFDKTDIVAAMMRAEIRAHIRSIEPSKRVSLLTFNPDPELVAAVFEAPEFLTDVTGEFRANVEKAFVDAHHPQELAAIEQEAEILDVVGMGLSTSLKEVSDAIDFRTEHEFNKWMVSVTPEVDREIAKSGCVAPDVDLVISMAKSLPDYKDRFRVTDAILEMGV